MVGRGPQTARPAQWERQASAIRAEDDPKSRVTRVKVGDGSGTERRGPMMHLGRVQEILIRSLDDRRVVLIAGKLQEPLAQHVHATELGEQTIERLPLDHRDNSAI